MSKKTFLNTSVRFVIPIAGERVTWVCIRLCLWPVKYVETWAWHASLHLIRQFLHSYWSRATAETVVPHHAISATRKAFPFKELFTRGRRKALPGCCFERNHWTIHFFAFILLFDYKMCWCFWPKRYLWLGIKVCWNGVQLVAWTHQGQVLYNLPLVENLLTTHWFPFI